MVLRVGIDDLGILINHGLISSVVYSPDFGWWAYLNYDEARTSSNILFTTGDSTNKYIRVHAALSGAAYAALYDYSGLSLVPFDLSILQGTLICRNVESGTYTGTYYSYFEWSGFIVRTNFVEPLNGYSVIECQGPGGATFTLSRTKSLTTIVLTQIGTFI